MNLFEYAMNEGISMSELGQRGGRKTQAKRRAKVRQEDHEVEKKEWLQTHIEDGTDWWNN